MIGFLFSEDKRDSLHGWAKGGYTAHCRCCGCDFVGAKGSYNCADCAYTFNDQLEYERLWRNVGWQYTVEYFYKKRINKL